MSQVTSIVLNGLLQGLIPGLQGQVTLHDIYLCNYPTLKLAAHLPCIVDGQRFSSGHVSLNCIYLGCRNGELKSKMSEITWGLCCRSPDFLLPQTEDLQHMPWHIAKRHFGYLQTLIDMLRLNWKPE